MNTKKTLIFLALSLMALVALSACGAEETPTPVVEESPGLDYVIAEGIILPVQQSWLNFAAPGRVAEVLVAEGDQVNKGQVLAQLGDTESAQAAREGAALELLSVQQALNAFTRTAGLSTAQAWVAYQEAQSQRAQLETLWERLNLEALEEDVDEAWDEFRDREDDLEEAREEWENKQDLDEDNATRKAAKDDLEEAQENLNQAQRDLEAAQRAIDGPRAALDAALAAEQEALRVYEMWENEGFDTDQKALLEGQFSAAEAGLAAAEKALEGYTLTAPFAGTITDLYLEVGQLIGPEVPAAQLADLSTFEIKTRDLTELEVVKITEGQAVEIAPDALPDLVLMGTVERIGESFTTQTGDILYTVTISLDETDPDLRWGMTVELKFISD
jgi:multidrug efflux pump subunit AcrA (membrane-fusion protein)